MKWLFISIAILAFCHAAGQRIKPVASPLAINGSILFPSFQNLEAEVVEPSVVFQTMADYEQGKLFSKIIRLKITSTQPWLVSVRSGSTHLIPLQANQAGVQIPVQVFSLKGNLGLDFTPLSTQAQPLLRNENSKVRNEYLLDAKFNPGWNYAGGSYSVALVFTLTAQ